jgi:hypothetical protein
MCYIQESNWSVVTTYHPISFLIEYIVQIIPTVHSIDRVSCLHIFIINLCILLLSSIQPCFINSAGMLSDPAALCMLSFFITLFTS